MLCSLLNTSRKSVQAANGFSRVPLMPVSFAESGGQWDFLVITNFTNRDDSGLHPPGMRATALVVCL
jgi:hypothetical protein